MKESLVEILEEPTMKEYFEDTSKEDRIKPCTKSCYSCGEEGHISQNCLNGDLVEFPTDEVEYDPQEIEALIGMEKSRKRSRLDSRKDLSHITCYRCQGLGHYAYKCRKKKPRAKRADTIPKKPKDLSEVMCLRCQETGHYANKCPDKMKAGAK